MKIPYFIVPLTTVLMAHPSYSQVGGDKELVLTLNGSVTNELLGTDLAHAGDANGDGYDDLLVSTGSDVARLYSGMDGTIIYEWALGNSVANLGDIDHDGTDDFGIGGSNNSATVISGATNTVIYSLTGPSFSQFGKSVASAGDLDLDGTPDFLVGAPGVDINGWGTAGACLAFSGATGMQLFYLPTPNPRHWGQFGWSVFSPGDLNSDGYPDLIVEAIGDANAAEEPKVYIFSGKDQSQLAYYNWGSQARSTGDVDGDGVGDYSLIYSGADAEVRSGATHNILFFLTGGSIDGIGDIDNDGRSDLAAHEYSTNNPRQVISTIHSGMSQVEQMGLLASDVINAQAINAGNIRGDGNPHLAIAYKRWGNHGRVEVYRFHPLLSLSNRSLTASGTEVVSANMDFPASEAGRSYCVLASASGVGPIQAGNVFIPLTEDNIFHAALRGTADNLFVFDRIGKLDANGTETATMISHPALTAMVGQSLYFAAVTFNVNRVRMSSAVTKLEILP